MILQAVFLSLALATAPTSSSTNDWQRVVGLLQYLQADYPAAVASASATELEEQRSFAAEAVSGIARLGPDGEPFVAPLAALQKRINSGEDPAGVSRDCARLIDEIVAAGGLSRSPRHAPDLEKGRALFGTLCASCHGVDGRATTPLAATLTPRPADFTSDELMAGLTPFKAFNVVSFGVKGTAMPAFDTLGEDDRWALAFFVFTLRQPACPSPAAPLGLEVLANSTDSELATKTSVPLACLRRALPVADEASSLHSATAAVREGLKLAAAHDPRASQVILDAYLNDIEPVEARLKARSPELVTRIEQSFLDVREEMQSGGDAQAKGQLLVSQLEDAAHLGATTTASVFWLALFIILREGFEAMVVIIALLAVLKKMGEPQHARIVHAGWVSALIAGAAAFVFGQQLLAGANREWMEGVTALVAVAMLVYAALWLNARSNMRAYMAELRDKVSGALGRGSLFGFFFISFMAAGRESFETALFLQGLSIDSPSGAAWGSLTGLFGLAVLVLGFTGAGVRLPMQLVFKVSTALLFVTAVILMGKGIHSLQEVGVVPLVAVPFLRIDLFGIYADGISLVAQLLLGVLPLVLSRRGRKSA